jgi:hypothetical protein
VNDYGCEDCGAVGWHRDGEKIVQVGEQDGAPVVQRVVTEPGYPENKPWLAECSHKLRSGSILERFFSVFPIDEPMALPKNG